MAQKNPVVAVIGFRMNNLRIDADRCWVNHVGGVRAGDLFSVVVILIESAGPFFYLEKGTSHIFLPYYTY